MDTIWLDDDIHAIMSVIATKFIYYLALMHLK